MRGDGAGSGQVTPPNHPGFWGAGFRGAYEATNTLFRDFPADWPGSTLYGGFYGAFWNLQSFKWQRKRPGAFVPSYPGPWRWGGVWVVFR